MFERAGRKNSNNKQYQFWQQHNQPIELNNARITSQKLNYLHMNPVVSEIVENPEDYAGIKGLIDILFIE